MPLALEYAFWTERGAGAFAAFGPGATGAELAALPRPERLVRMEADLAALLDRLGADVISHEPGRFHALATGRKGVGGVYDLWRRIAAGFTGRRFEPAHRPADGHRLGGMSAVDPRRGQARPATAPDVADRAVETPRC